MEVIATEPSIKWKSDGYHGVYGYNVAGKTYEETEGRSVSYEPEDPGTSYKVCYNPDDPEDSSFVSTLYECGSVGLFVQQ